MKNKKYLAMGLIIILMFVSGCVNNGDISSVVNTLPEVQQYLKEHPDAKITATYMSKEEIENISQDINSQCGKTITPIDMYKVIITDKDLKITSWIDANNKNLVCTSADSAEKASPSHVQTTINMPTNTIPVTTETIEKTPGPTTSLQSYCGNPDTEYATVTISDIYSKSTSGKCVQFTGKVYSVLPKSIVNENGVQKEISAFEVGAPNDNYLVYVSIPTYKIEGNVQQGSIIEVKGKDSGNYLKGTRQPVIWAQRNIKTVSVDNTAVPVPTVVDTTAALMPTTVDTTSNPTEYINVRHSEQTATKIRNKAYTTETKYETPESGKVYLIITYDLTNNGYPEFKTDFTDWKISVSTQDNPNTYVYTEIDIPTLNSLDYVYPQATMQSGGKLKGQLAYQVPTNWKDYKVIYGPSYKGINFKYSHV